MIYQLHSNYNSNNKKKKSEENKTLIPSHEKMNDKKTIQSMIYQ